MSTLTAPRSDDFTAHPEPGETPVPSLRTTKINDRSIILESESLLRGALDSWVDESILNASHPVGAGVGVGVGLGAGVGSRLMVTCVLYRLLTLIPGPSIENEMELEAADD